ncbi:uncharacterized protein NESG_00134 [Nematocida ausubeli]|uniref:OB domain-containing protein n=1 Tax=Nematocida ausubeli (strain ATCC PRA-371 / ERTm2) TaxID=1913371 RepID=A0A086J4J3_NEMA1|nr:uncharacterized protein NESG_00134 [Nematocida ausubeli]KFG27061.1 hypothetical protein NESG_00134 [Nematocida ausubeli]
MSSLSISDGKGVQTIRRMPIKHVKQVDFNDAIKITTQFRGQEISLVEVVGWITTESPMQNGGKRFTISDGTDSIWCTQWADKNYMYVKKGALVRVIGTLSRNEKGDKNVNITCSACTLVTDGNSVVYHLLMRIVDSVRSPAYSMDAPSILTENSPATTQEDMRHQGNFKKIHLDILSFFSHNQGETGLLINMVVSSLASSKVYTSADVNSGLEYLISAGKLFYCTDDRKTLALVE